MDKESKTVTYTYLDSSGRHTLEFEKYNVVDESNGLIKV
jgi:hypothetical protein